MALNSWGKALQDGRCSCVLSGLSYVYELSEYMKESYPVPTRLERNHRRRHWGRMLLVAPVGCKPCHLGGSIPGKGQRVCSVLLIDLLSPLPSAPSVISASHLDMLRGEDRCCCNKHGSARSKVEATQLWGRLGLHKQAALSWHQLLGANMLHSIQVTPPFGDYRSGIGLPSGIHQSTRPFRCAFSISSHVFRIDHQEGKTCRFRHLHRHKAVVINLTKARKQRDEGKDHGTLSLQGRYMTRHSRQAATWS
jgi:hypothetical protein